ncbi:MAG: ester cyclase [Zetaproteobacteria bacterium]|nr:ester cyclase [Zetaproteobacteria bacterium]
MLSEKQQVMANALEKHVSAELAGDLETTMATMTAEPHLHNVANMMGGVGYEGVKSFYKNNLVGKFFPPDVTMERISLTVGDTQVIEELVISYTHTVEVEWMLPKIAPTGKYVSVGFVVIVGFDEGKVTHEHIYWDQATVLVQLGLLDPTGLPVVGAESAKRLLDPSQPAKLYSAF